MANGTHLTDAGIYGDAATKSLAAFTKAFENSHNYWQLGHAFDTAVDYFSVVSATTATDFAKTATRQFTSATGSQQWPTWWYDDHGWWGIAALRASQHHELFGELTEAFAQISLRCWVTMDEMGQAVWKQRPRPEGGDPFKALEPRFPGGVWNYNWTAGVGNCDPTQGDKGKPLCGYQNTVTNLLYLILASRRYAAYRLDDDRDAADREYEFLTQWMNAAAPDVPLLDRYAPGKCLMRAEASSYASGEAVDPFEYSQEFIWTGDQGLLLAALVEQMEQVGKGSPAYQNLLADFENLLAGTLDRLTDENDNLVFWRSPSEAASGDSGDYETGPAVFFRALLHAYQTNDDLKVLLSDENGPYPAFIRANARTAVANDEPDLVSLANYVATLVAAAAILPSG
jgi:hypothetical protein